MFINFLFRFAQTNTGDNAGMIKLIAKNNGLFVFQNLTSNKGHQRWFENINEGRDSASIRHIASNKRYTGGAVFEFGNFIFQLLVKIQITGEQTSAAVANTP